MVQLNIASLLFALIVAVSLSARAEYSDPTTMVNVNEQTDLFEKSMDDWDGLQDQIRSQKSSTIEGIEGKQGLDSISSKSQSEIESSASSLSSIKATDLNSRGTEELSKENIMNDIYVDFSRPLNKQHMVDAKKLAKGQDRLMDNLLNKLKEIGVDCKTVKGPVEKEPTYYLQIEKTQHKDTVYNKTICEELCNRYRCTDSVSLTCKKRGIKWTDWEQKEMPLNGVWIYRAHMGWFYPKKWTDSRYGLLLREGNSIVKAEMRAHIAANEGVPLENIHEHVSFGGRGEGRTVHADKNMYAFEVYKVHYYLRLGEEICEEWEEDWDERCDLDKIAAPVSSRSGERG